MFQFIVLVIVSLFIRCSFVSVCVLVVRHVSIRFKIASKRRPVVLCARVGRQSQIAFFVCVFKGFRCFRSQSWGTLCVVYWLFCCLFAVFVCCRFVCVFDRSELFCVVVGVVHAQS